MMLSLPPTVWAGKLEETRKTVREGPDPQTSKKKRPSQSRDGSESDGGSELFLACLIPFVLPFCIVSLALSDRQNSDPSKRRKKEARFLTHPYASGRQGHLVLKRDTPPIAAVPTDPDVKLITDMGTTQESASRLRGRLSVGYGYDLDGLHIPQVHGSLDSSAKIGLDTEWRMYLEPLPSEPLDRLLMGTVNLTLRLIEDTWGELHLGSGGRIMWDDGIKGGFNGLFRLTLFPVQPLILTVDIQMGNVGFAFLVEAQGTIGISLRHGELLGGYRGMMLVGEKRAVVFQGPIAAVRLWF